jgi:hypothetical protein
VILQRYRDIATRSRSRSIGASLDLVSTALSDSSFVSDSFFSFCYEVQIHNLFIVSCLVNYGGIVLVRERVLRTRISLVPPSARRGLVTERKKKAKR